MVTPKTIHTINTAWQKFAGVVMAVLIGIAGGFLLAEWLFLR